MGFTDTGFLLALVPVTLLAWCMPRRAKPAFLLLASWCFYATWSPAYLLLLIAVSTLTYAAGRVIGGAAPDRRRYALLSGGLLALLTILAVFKYSAILAPLLPMAAGASLRSLLVPLGISYYMFKAISYLMDIYYDEMPAERDPVRVALYLAFFPQILSGPIQRAPNFMAQTREAAFCMAQPVRIERAIGLMILGCFEKLVLADRIGPLVAACDAPAAAPPLMALLADDGYALQLFADFAGLTHIALGLGLLLGIEGPPNFNRPFAAHTIQDFWRRWHMSLTTWLADYLFMPLRMSLRHLGTTGLCLSLMINMMLIGLWHGGTWTYLVFGLVHGVFLTGSVLTLPARDTWFRSRPGLRRLRIAVSPIVTFHMVVFGMVFFRAPDLSFALHNLAAILGFGLPDPAAWHTLDRAVWLQGAMAALIALELGTGALRLHRLGAAIAAPTNPLLCWATYAACGLATILLAVQTGSPFMYARF